MEGAVSRRKYFNAFIQRIDCTDRSLCNCRYTTCTHRQLDIRTYRLMCFFIRCPKSTHVHRYEWYEKQGLIGKASQAMEATMTCAALCCNEIVRQVCEDPLLGNVASGNRYIHLWRDLYATGLQLSPYQSGQQWYHDLLWHLGEMLGLDMLWVYCKSVPCPQLLKEWRTSFAGVGVKPHILSSLDWIRRKLVMVNFLSSLQFFSQLFSHRFSTHLNSPEFFPCQLTLLARSSPLPNLFLSQQILTTFSFFRSLCLTFT